MNGVTLVYPCCPPSRDPFVVLKLLGSLRSLEANALPESVGRVVVVTSEAGRFQAALDGVLVVEAPDLCAKLRNSGVADASKHWSILSNAFTALDAAFPGADDGHALMLCCDTLLAFGPCYDLRRHPLLVRTGALTMAQHAMRTDPSSGGPAWKRSVAATARLLEGSPGFDGRMYSTHAPVWIGVREARWIREKMGWGEEAFRARPESCEPWSMFAAASFALGVARPVAKFDDRKPGSPASLAEGVAESRAGREFISYGEPADLPLAALAMFGGPSRWEKPGAVVRELAAARR